MSTFPNCHVCHQQFSLKGPTPFLLPCLHAVCETCVASGGVITCSPCQRDINLTETTLQKDVVREKEILHLTVQHNPELVLCTNEDDGNQAVCWCKECGDYLCENCQMVHDRLKMTKHHDVLDIGELQPGSLEEDNYCTVHPRYILDAWDKDCCMLTCGKCRLCDHAGHEVVDFDEVAETAKEEVAAFAQKVQSTVDNNLTGQDLQSGEETCNIINEQIANTFNDLKVLLNQREKEVNIELQKYKKKMREEQREKNKCFQSCQTTSDFINKTLLYSSRHDVMSLRHVLQGKTEECIKSVETLVQKSSPLPKFNTDGLEKIKSALSGFGTIALKEDPKIEGAIKGAGAGLSSFGSDLAREEEHFGERATLYIFHTQSYKWKERCVGEMKILFNKDTKRYRILMRGDQVFDISANHNISKDMKLTPMVCSDRAWCWSAVDFIDEEKKMGELAVKFETLELTTKFKDCFETCQKMETQSKPETPGSTDIAEKQDNKEKSLTMMFEPKTGSRECSTHCCQNEGEKMRCPACNTVKPGAEEEVKKAEAPAPGATAGFEVGGGFKIGGGTAAGGFGTGAGGFGTGAGVGAGGFSFGSPSAGGFLFLQKPTQHKAQWNKVSSSVSEAPAAKETSKEPPKYAPKGAKSDWPRFS